MPIPYTYVHSCKQKGSHISSSSAPAPQKQIIFPSRRRRWRSPRLRWPGRATSATPATPAGAKPETWRWLGEAFNDELPASLAGGRLAGRQTSGWPPKHPPPEPWVVLWASKNEKKKPRNYGSQNDIDAHGLMDDAASKGKAQNELPR